MTVRTACISVADCHPLRTHAGHAAAFRWLVLLLLGSRVPFGGVQWHVPVDLAPLTSLLGEAAWCFAYPGTLAVIAGSNSEVQSSSHTPGVQKTETHVQVLDTKEATAIGRMRHE